MKYGVTEVLFCTHKIAQIQFFSFYFFKTSGIFASSLDINVSQHILSIYIREINPFEFRTSFFTFFAFFLEIMKNGVRYLVALTTSICKVKR